MNGIRNGLFEQLMSDKTVKEEPVEEEIKQIEVEAEPEVVEQEVVEVPEVIQKAEPIYPPGFNQMSFAEKLSWKLGIKNVTESQVYDDFMTDFTDADHADIEARSLIFERLAADFSCEVGKVSKEQTNDQSIKQCCLVLYGTDSPFS